jgi:Na+/H+ antiporter NhaA
MAQVIWPVMIPLSVLLMEKNATRKKILTVLLAVGAAAAVYYLYGLVFHHAYAEIRGRHISYQNSVTDSLGVTGVIVYLAAVILPLFISSIKRMYVLGIILALSFVVSAVFYTQCLTSVWCFFAAVISFVIFYIIRDSHAKFHLEKHGKK